MVVGIILKGGSGEAVGTSSGTVFTAGVIYQTFSFVVQFKASVR